MKEDEIELLNILGNLSNGVYLNKNFKVLNTKQMAPQQYCHTEAVAKIVLIYLKEPYSLMDKALFKYINMLGVSGTI